MRRDKLSYPFGLKEHISGHVVIPNPPTHRQAYAGWLLAMADYIVEFTGQKFFVTSIKESSSLIEEVSYNGVRNYIDEVALGLVRNFGVRGARDAIKVDLLTSWFAKHPDTADDILRPLWGSCLLGATDVLVSADILHKLMFQAFEHSDFKEQLLMMANTSRSRCVAFANSVVIRKFKGGGFFAILPQQVTRDFSAFVFFWFPKVDVVYRFTEHGNVHAVVRRDRMVEAADAEIAYIKTRIERMGIIS